MSVGDNHWQTLTAELHSRGLRPLIEQSWTRSSEARIRRDEKRLFRRLDTDAIAERLQANAILIGVSEPYLISLSRSLGPLKNVAYLTDRDGIILFSTGYEVWRAVQGLLPGYDWSEETMGTNGAGTAIASRQPVAVIGPDHYLSDFSEASCFGCPLFSSGQELVGAIDLSLAVEDSRAHHLEQVIATAEAIQRDFSRRN